ncbi:hypothetical protein BDN70DRAFT_879975 [Pholiota conissans]|uniref:DUF6593 domain-containing protein n=1 Tax=Pholiota conissans TaxID=109636 RepID=A0A9P5Z1L5_9AGAR|nr:hypothetical protein BDN70DRAFT_879975 [Pholiota conissans]
MILDTKTEPVALPPPEILPDYNAAVSGGPSNQRRPTQAPVIYTFSDWAKGTMLLMPPRSESPEQRPLYRITVELDLNPFLPVSYITKVMRCTGDENDMVAEFAFSLNQKRAVIRLADTATRLSSVINNINSSPKHFNWVLGTRLHWDCRTSLDDGSPLCICSLPGKPQRNGTRAQDIQIASFVPPPIDASPPLPEATLTIFPHGHEHMDEILVSALVVERMLTR